MCVSWNGHTGPCLFRGDGRHARGGLAARSEAMPGRQSPRSEGKCALYGREQASEHANMSTWRARLHNESAGMPRTDISGANTTLSLVWNPSSTHKDVYKLQSHRKTSQLKMIQDFGGRAAGVPVQPAAPPPPPVATTSAAVPPPEPEASPRRAFLDGETARLKAAAHARSIGQTFLTSGNLSQAKAYLARAERILQVDEKHLRGKSAKQILDELMAQRYDPHM